MTPSRSSSLDLSALLNEHQRKLLGLALRITGDFELAEDALQQTFMQAHLSASSFRGESSPGTWLYRIAVREAVRLRNSRRERPLGRGSMADPAELERANGERSAKSPEWQEQTLRLLRALDELPEEQRMALVLLSVHELSAEVTGEILGIAPATVYTRAFRARLMLRDRLGGE